MAADTEGLTDAGRTSPRTPIRLSPSESAAVAGKVLLPLVAQGAILRRPRVTAWAERRQTDRAAASVLGTLRERHAAAPLLVPMGPRRVVVPVHPDDVGALLRGSPEPFSPASREKRAALRHFEPDSVLISPASRRPPRRAFNEGALDTKEPVHAEAEALVAAVTREADALVAESRRRGTLDWSVFAPAFWRAVRTVVLGTSARDDEHLTEVLARLRGTANWAYLRPRRPRLREEFDRLLDHYVDLAEPGSLMASAATAADATDVDPRGQAPQWLFAFDAAGAAVIRALAVVASRPDVRDRLRAESAAGDPSLPYARGCVLESVRLWPTTLVILRDSTSTTTWGEADLPAGTSFAIVSAFFHRDGDRLPFAHDFVPDAWLDGSADADWSLVPFSGGPVSCPGRNVVLLVASHLLARLAEEDLDYSRSRYLARAPLPATFDHAGVALTAR